ncbi:MAG: hypothetical protein H6702_14835 [Myxococcales bacterium]|nr:hypothetical protein [Myxococcales bacterium]
MIEQELEQARFAHEAKLAWFKAWSPVVLTCVTGVAAYLTVDLHNQRMDVRKLTLEQARFQHEAAMEARKFERDTNLGFIAQFLEQDDEVKRLALIDFIHQTADDDGLRAWAEVQKAAVAQEVATLRKALADAEQAKSEALKAQLEQFKREQEAAVAAAHAEAERLAAEGADKARQAEARRRAAAARAEAEVKAQAAADARAKADKAAAEAEVASEEAQTTEARVRGVSARAEAPARGPVAALMPTAPEKPAGALVPTFSNYDCRCGLKTLKVAAPNQAAANKLCDDTGPLCRLVGDRPRLLRR